MDVFKISVPVVSGLAFWRRLFTSLRNTTRVYKPVVLLVFHSFRDNRLHICKWSWLEAVFWVGAYTHNTVILFCPTDIFHKSIACKVHCLPTLDMQFYFVKFCLSHRAWWRQMGRAARECCTVASCTCSMVTYRRAVVKVHECLHT